MNHAIPPEVKAASRLILCVSNDLYCDIADQARAGRMTATEITEFIIAGPRFLGVVEFATKLLVFPDGSPLQTLRAAVATVAAYWCDMHAA